MNLAPRLSTCSLAAGRTSVAVTMAPRRRAVAIACRPATPAPMTKTLVAGTVPAAVIIIGSARPESAAPSIPAREELHREARDTGVGHGAQRRLVAVGVHDGDDDRAFLQARELGTLWAAHPEHDIGVLQRVGRHGG